MTGRTRSPCLHNDPYFEAGLYREVEFHAFSAVAGTWVGGATWRRSG